MSSCWSDACWETKLPVGEYGPKYYSQRGEDCPPRLDKNMKVFLAFGEEYSYIFRNGEWVCYNMHEFEDNKRPEIVEIPEGALAV